MAKLILLGTANAIPNRNHENTHFVLKGDESSVLVDCVGNTLLRLQQVDIDLESLNDIILTHCHPDHISGVPPLLMNLWLKGRVNSLNIHGLHHTLDCVEKMMELYEWREWPNFFPVVFHRLSSLEMELVLKKPDFQVFSSPVHHIIPTIGLRIESLSGNKAIAYSCDTEPCPEVVRLGAGADILFHEATGESYGHSSAAQAGEIAAKAGVKTLYLIHFPPEKYGSEELLAQARKNFSGNVKYASDFLELVF
jgi:ribonuclease Z